MFEFIKYKYILELADKHKNDFCLASSNNIVLSPPILKKNGLSFYLYFLVIDYCKDTSEIKRPIGIITVNRFGKEKLFDLKNFEFSYNNSNFKKVFYTYTNDYFPSNCFDQIEKFKISIDYLQRLLSRLSIFKKINNQLNKDYLQRVRMLFPKEYWCFFEDLNNNEIEELTTKQKLEREKEETLYLTYQQECEEEKQKRLQEKQNRFINFVKKEIHTFTKDEIIPLLKGKGTYTKLLFYNELGKRLKDIYTNKNLFSKFEMDFDKENITLKDELYVEVVKTYSKACQNKYATNIPIDTLSKVLIVFLNSLLIEEIHNKVIDSFESEIAECISIFEEDNKKILDEDARITLIKFYKDLCKDYKTAEEKHLSNLYTGYILIHNNNY